MSLTTPTRVAALVIFTLAVTIAAIAETKHEDFNVNTTGGHFNVRVAYETENAYVGNNYLELTVSIQSPDSDALEVKGCDSIDEWRIQCKPEGQPTRGKELLERIWKYRANIGIGVEPRLYPIKFTFGLPNDSKSDQTQEIRLLVGVTSNLKVRPDGLPTQPPEIYTGVDNHLRVSLVNDYLNYPVHVQTISVRSDPDWIVDKNTMPIKVDRQMDPSGGRMALDIPFKAAPVGFSSLINGLGNSTIILDIVYDDTYGRKIAFSQPVTVRVRPRDRVLVLAMFIGVIVGSWIKFYLQRLQTAGQISRRQALTFVLATMGIGLVVAVVAMVGQIQIVAFNTNGSYDKPMVLFSIALAGALGGAQLLSTWLKKA
jgi:hypothetical protein